MAKIKLRITKIHVFFSLGWTCVGKSKKIILKNIFITLIRAMLLKVIQKNLLNSRPN